MEVLRRMSLKYFLILAYEMVYDYYKILEIPRNASLDDIKRAYRSKAKKIHPDINNSPKANEIFIVVNEAYEILTNDRKRYLHDLKLNYADTAKIDSGRKKQYYRTYSKTGTSANASHSNFNKNWNNSEKEGYKLKTTEHYYIKSSIIYNLFFISCMLSGFLILIVTVTGTIRNYWPAPFVLISIGGIVLIRDGWKGILGKKTFANSIMKIFRK